MHVTRRAAALSGLLLAASLSRAATATTNAAASGGANATVAKAIAAATITNASATAAAQAKSAGATNAPVADLTTNAPIIVTASRAGSTVEDLPSRATVISAAAIRDAGAQNVVDALEKLGGLYFRHNSDNPGLADISMRGFGENSHGRVLVLVDGQPLNTPDMASLDWLRIPVASVERIEVLSGGQTALYGNYAVAGVINIITRQAGDKPETTLSVTAGSDNTLAGHIGHTGSIGDTVHYSADADWRRGDGWRENGDYENADVRASIAKEWSERLTTSISAFCTENRYGMPGYLTAAQMQANPRQTMNPSDEAVTRTFGGAFNFTGQVGTDGRLEGAFAVSHRTIESNWVPYSYSYRTLNTYTFTPRYILDADLAGHRNKLLTGVDLGLSSLALDSFDDAAHAAQNTDAMLRRANAGAYAQDEFWLTDKLALTLGARGELYRYTAKVADFTQTPLTSLDTLRVYRQSALDAALLWRPTEPLKLFARAATLYRDPFVDELTSTYGGFYGAPGMNLDLKPEIGQQYEIGSSLALAKEWTASLSLYRLDMHNEIAWNGVENANLDDTRRYGLETALGWQRQGVGLVSLNYNYVEAYFASGDNREKQIPLVPAQTLTAHGELELPLDLAALATVHGVSAQYLGQDNSHEAPRLASYGTLDLGLRYRPHWLKGCELFAGVDNVFDHIYANSGFDSYGFLAYYPSAGRTWRVSASYRF